MATPPALKRTLIRIAAVLAILLAGLSVTQGSRNAMLFYRSQDFRWSPAHLVVQHIDPWQEMIQGNPHHGIIFSQVPNDLPLLYVLIFPVGLLSFGKAKALWLACNLLFTGLTVYFGSRFFGLSRLETLFAASLYLMSSALRVCLGNGQQAVLTVLFLTLAIYAGSPRCPVIPWWTGLGFFKYNFAPPFWVYGAIRCGWRWAVKSLIPCIVSLVLVTLWLHGNLLHIAREPMAVAKLTLSFDPTWDLMSVLQIIALNLPHHGSTFVPFCQGAAILLLIFLTWRLGRPSSRIAIPAQAALVSYMGPLLITHNNYDMILLVLPFFYLVRHRAGIWSKIALAAIAYIWFATAIVDRLTFSEFLHHPFSHMQHLALINFCILATGFIALWQSATQPQSLTSPPTELPS